MLWKAVASLQYVTVAKRQVAWMHIGTQDAISVDGSQKNVSVIACVPDPFEFVAGDLRLVQNAMYNLTCHDCISTNCLNSSLNVSSFAIVKQPAFSFVPVNLTVPWFNDPGYAVIRAANEIILARSKRFVGMLIAGITALVALIATAATATIALTEGIQTAEFVNELSHNVSVAFQTQEDWDRKIEQKLNALYDTVRVVGEELNSLEVRSSLKCHAMFSHICVTPFPYNSTTFPWDKIRNHLLGIWHNCNTSLDLAALHKEIRNLAEAPPIDIDIARDAQNFLSALAKRFPTFNQLMYNWIGVGIFVLLFLLLIPCIFRVFVSQINGLYVDLKWQRLDMTKNEVPLHCIK
ncbi:endogenous retrovirus group K member 13-1 Env polyprotein-like isoform 1-T1 [Glossophaga mutica]